MGIKDLNFYYEDDKYSNYTRELDLDKALVTVKYNIGDEVYYNTSGSSFSIKLCKLVDNLLDINKTVKVAVSFKKINIQCFLTDEEIEFLEKHFKYIRELKNAL
mgnify:CR=1 FL=1